MVAATPDVPAQIVTTATRLFAARGFDGTSLQDIADVVGVTKQAVIHHFSSKEQVRRAVLDGILAHWNATLPALLLAATATEDRFAAVLGELHRFFAADPDRARVILREALDRPAEVKRLLEGPVGPWLGAVAGYIQRGQHAGQHLPDVDAEAYVVHVLMLVLSAVAGSAVMQAPLGPDARERYDRELFRIVHAALFPTALPASASRVRATKSRPKSSKTTKSKAR